MSTYPCLIKFHFSFPMCTLHSNNIWESWHIEMFKREWLIPRLHIYAFECVYINMCVYIYNIDIHNKYPYNVLEEQICVSAKRIGTPYWGNEVSQICYWSPTGEIIIKIFAYYRLRLFSRVAINFVTLIESYRVTVLISYIT